MKTRIRTGRAALVEAATVRSDPIRAGDYGRPFPPVTGQRRRFDQSRLRVRSKTASEMEVAVDKPTRGASILQNLFPSFCKKSWRRNIWKARNKWLYKGDWIHERHNKNPLLTTISFFLSFLCEHLLQNTNEGHVMWDQHSVNRRTRTVALLNPQPPHRLASANFLKESGQPQSCLVENRDLIRDTPLLSRPLPASLLLEKLPSVVGPSGSISNFLIILANKNSRKANTNYNNARDGLSACDELKKDNPKTENIGL
ncbi:hypothetical protein STAS_09670 [Striga asiatica]|uniref:Uncharacterized protein n=1 Tax=Striga asiatica TaxID=4170 RepID=A0A5A7PLD5_STRAF|nr:hypothetical protein STAS_09670 [Striga asiatica]